MKIAYVKKITMCEIDEIHYTIVISMENVLSHIEYLRKYLGLATYFVENYNAYISGSDIIYRTEEDAKKALEYFESVILMDKLSE